MKSPIATHTQKWLCVEDNITFQCLIRSILADQSVKLEFVTHGSDAIDAFSANDYTAILIDLTLPDMSGLKLIEELSHIERSHSLNHTPMIMLCGQASPKLEADIYRAGADGLIEKSITTTQLWPSMSAINSQNQSHLTKNSANNLRLH